MKDKIQHKINQIRERATMSKATANDSHMPNHMIDNLSKSIRNKKEADQFFIELKSAVSLAKSNR